MKIATTVTLLLAFATLPASAIDFLGVELCKGSIDTRVEVPVGSSLILESAEIGDHGGLIMLLSARSGKVMGHVDDLMTGLTGNRGTGDADTLEWSDGRLTGVAQRVAKKYAALAVASTDECSGSEVPPPVPAAESAPAAPPEANATEDPQPPTIEEPAPAPDLLPDSVVPAAAAATAVATSNSPPPPQPEPMDTATPDFELIGTLSHEAADRTWVDVMGVVANYTVTGYKLATFDLSFFDTDGGLICVDTISVSLLKPGQERAFRDSIRCPGYDPDAVKETRLQFAGGL